MPRNPDWHIIIGGDSKAPSQAHSHSELSAVALCILQLQFPCCDRAVRHTITMSTLRRILLLVPCFVAGFVAGFFNVQPLLLLSSIAERLVQHSPSKLEQQSQGLPVYARLAAPRQQMWNCNSATLAAARPLLAASARISDERHIVTVAQQAPMPSNPAAGRVNSGAGQSLLLSDQQRAAQRHPVAKAPLPLPGQQPCSVLQHWVWACGMCVVAVHS